MGWLGPYSELHTVAAQMFFHCLLLVMPDLLVVVAAYAVCTHVQPTCSVTFWKSSWDASVAHKHLKEGAIEKRVRLFSVGHSDSTGDNEIGGSSWTSGSDSLFHEWWSPGTGGPEMLWGLLLGDLQKVSGCGHGHPSSGGPVRAGVGPEGPRGPYQPP